VDCLKVSLETCSSQKIFMLSFGSFIIRRGVSKERPGNEESTAIRRSSISDAPASPLSQDLDSMSGKADEWEGLRRQAKKIERVLEVRHVFISDRKYYPMFE
jgi:hypothetical protein